MQKHDRAYSVCEFRKKFVCDNEKYYQGRHIDIILQ